VQEQQLYAAIAEAWTVMYSARLPLGLAPRAQERDQNSDELSPVAAAARSESAKGKSAAQDPDHEQVHEAAVAGSECKLRTASLFSSPGSCASTTDGGAKPGEGSGADSNPGSDEERKAEDDRLTPAAAPGEWHWWQHLDELQIDDASRRAAGGGGKQPSVAASLPPPPPPVTAAVDAAGNVVGAAAPAGIMAHQKQHIIAKSTVEMTSARSNGGDGGAAEEAARMNAEQWHTIQDLEGRSVHDRSEQEIVGLSRSMCSFAFTSSSTSRIAARVSAFCQGRITYQ